MRTGHVVARYGRGVRCLLIALSGPDLSMIRLLVDAVGCRPALEAIIGWHLPLADERERRSTYPARCRGVSSVSRA